MEIIRDIIVDFAPALLIAYIALCFIVWLIMEPLRELYLDWRWLMQRKDSMPELKLRTRLKFGRARRIIEILKTQDDTH